MEYYRKTAETKNRDYYFKVKQEPCDCGFVKEVLYQFIKMKEVKAISWFCSNCGIKKKVNSSKLNH